jgi:RNA polymerase sigma-70 factor (ECF subfamily)
VLLSSDRQLLERYRRGEPEALARVYDEYAGAVAAFLTRGFTFSSKGRLLQFVGYHQPFDLENAVQETFVRAFGERARLAYDGINPYKSYLLAIARNLVLSELRRREVAMSQLVQVREGEEASPLLAAAEPVGGAQGETLELSAETRYLHRELARLYQNFVASLDRRETRYFEARFEQRRTRLEAGQRAALSAMQARTLEKKLRKRFLAYMQAHGYLEGYGAKAAVVTS